MNTSVNTTQATPAVPAAPPIILVADQSQPTASACCSTTEQASCCEPTDKAACCGAAPATTCGCRG